MAPRSTSSGHPEHRLYRFHPGACSRKSTLLRRRPGNWQHCLGTAEGECIRSSCSLVLGTAGALAGHLLGEVNSRTEVPGTQQLFQCSTCGEGLECKLSAFAGARIPTGPSNAEALFGTAEVECSAFFWDAILAVLLKPCLTELLVQSSCEAEGPHPHPCRKPSLES